MKGPQVVIGEPWKIVFLEHGQTEVIVVKTPAVNLILLLRPTDLAPIDDRQEPPINWMPRPGFDLWASCITAIRRN